MKNTLLGNVKISTIFCKKQIIEIQTEFHGKFLFIDLLLQRTWAVHRALTAFLQMY